jgi:RNA polymerase sigma-70 factor (ECF subfamily)
LPKDKIYNERELLALVAEGDEPAFTGLFRLYRDRIYSIAFRLTHSSTLSEEIVQDIFLTIWIKRARLIEIENFSAYLFIVTRNEAYRALKHIARSYKAGSIAREAQSPGYNDTENYILGKEYNSLLQNAIDRLPNQQKQVYQLIKEQKLKREEVADLLHLQPETVKFHLAQAMKNIRSFCAPYLGLFLGFTVFLSLPGLLS